MTHSRAAENYSPLYFLASLGAGGLVVTFFMYLMFWVPHPGRPVPIFEDITKAFADGPLTLQVAIIVAVIGIAAFAVLNVKSLIWNLRQLSAFKKADSYQAFATSNAQSTLLAMPLALAMSINAMFIVGLVFVPRLWTVIEYLFPLAMIAFAIVGYLALAEIGRFLGRVLTEGGVFDVTAHNSFAQMLPAFALSMVGVGFAAPAAMSNVPAIVGLSLIGSTFFGVASLIYAVVALVTGFSSMLQHGTAREAGPTLMIVIPLMTVLGILFLRQDHGLHTTFEVHAAAGETMIFLARLLAVQAVFFGLGMVVLMKQRYFDDFILGSKTSPGSYALVCPGVALSVMLQFFVNKGLVGAEVIDKFSLVFWAVTALAIVFQFTMIWMVLRLNRQHFGTPPEPHPLPAE